MKKLSENQKKLRRRVLEISHKHRTIHLSSTLTMVDILDDIYQKRAAQDPIILSNGHSGLALYVVLEKFGFGNAEKLFEEHGVHPKRDEKHGIYCSTGSLGQGLPIAVGLALSNRDRNVFCTVSDGEMAEGSCWEALRVAEEQKLTNLEIHANFNGFSAYGSVDVGLLSQRLKSFNLNSIVHETSVEELPFLKGQAAHYYIMTDQDYKKALKILS